MDEVLAELGTDESDVGQGQLACQSLDRGRILAVADDGGVYLLVHERDGVQQSRQRLLWRDATHEQEPAGTRFSGRGCWSRAELRAYSVGRDHDRLGAHFVSFDQELGQAVRQDDDPGRGAQCSAEDPALVDTKEDTSQSTGRIDIEMEMGDERAPPQYRGEPDYLWREGLGDMDVHDGCPGSAQKAP